MDDGIVNMGEAADVGNTEGIYVLLQQDPFVLQRIDDLPFAQTPLHIAVQHMLPEQNDEHIRAANKRYAEFALEMMNLKPSFARKLNPSGLSPIHLLAVQNDQTLMVWKLLNIDKDLPRVKGKGGQTPLHFAAEQEALDLLFLFLEFCPECITDANIHGHTAFQVAVKNGRYEAAKLMASWIRRSAHKYSTTWERVVLNGEDLEGNTVLHMAALNNDPQMVRMLLDSNISKNEINLKSQTALDISEGQNGSGETMDVLRCAKCLNASAIPPRSTLAQSLMRSTKLSRKEKLSRDFKRRCKNFPKKFFNNLLVVYTLIVTATYQAGLSPPGGLTQANNPYNFKQGNTTDSKNISSTNQQPHAVGFENFSMFYFYIVNSLTFGATVCTMAALLLVRDQVNGSLSYPPLAYLTICYSFSVLIIFPTLSRGYLAIIILLVTSIVIFLPMGFSLLLRKLSSLKFAADT